MYRKHPKHKPNKGKKNRLRSSIIVKTYCDWEVVNCKVQLHIAITQCNCILHIAIAPNLNIRKTTE